jgi:hypothetical protein
MIRKYVSLQTADLQTARREFSVFSVLAAQCPR